MPILPFFHVISLYSIIFHILKSSSSWHKDRVFLLRIASATAREHSISLTSLLLVILRHNSSPFTSQQYGAPFRLTITASQCTREEFLMHADPHLKSKSSSCNLHQHICIMLHMQCHYCRSHFSSKRAILASSIMQPHPTSRIAAAISHD